MTKKACVIGWPIKHSRSPMIHGYWLKLHGIDGSYEKLAVDPANPSNQTISEIVLDLGFSGFNVTVPLKEMVMEGCDVIEDVALKIGAVNTVWAEQADGLVHGTNTDAYGFMAHLRASAEDWASKSGDAVVLGAGGAARAIVFGLLQAGVPKVYVYNRTRERADALVQHFADDVATGRLEAGDWDARGQSLAAAALLVNTTSLGMTGAPQLEIDLSPMPEGSVVADIVYVPLETELLKQARKRGLVCVDGLGMLLHQAVPGFEKWFGVRPEVTDELRALVVADLEKTS